MTDKTERDTCVPIIARVAGLPASTMTALASARSLEAIDQLDALEGQLDALREEAAARIFEVLTSADPDDRRALLKLKRDCFNKRSIGKHRQAAYWPSLRRWIGDVGDRMGAVEDELAAAQERFRACYRDDRNRGRQQLRELSRDAGLMRGITLASPGLVAHIDRLHQIDVQHYQRREHKVLHSFLRYASRAAVKLSPYSTLSKIGFGVVAGDERTPVRYLEGERHEQSLVRVKRYLLDQCCRLLFHHPAVRDRLTLLVNGSVEDLGDALYRFIRPMVLETDESSGELRHTQPSIVQVRLRGPLIAWLLESLGEGMRYADAHRTIVEEFEAAPQSIEATIGKLVNIGFLRLVPPWASYESHLEPRLLSFLRDIASEPGLGAVIAVLDELVAIETGFIGVADLLHAVSRIDQLVVQLFDRIKEATRPDSTLRFEKAEHNYYEDVLLHAGDRAPTHEILRIDRATATELLETGDLLWTLSNFFESRHEFQHVLYRFITERWPGRTQVPFLEVFAAIQPLWEKYLGHLAAIENRGRVFDPYGLEEIAALSALRTQLRGELYALYSESEDGIRVSVDGLRALCARIPAQYRRPLAPCLFVQPVDPEGRTWVVNRFFEGTGRFSSRYTAVLTPDMRAAYIGQFERRGRVMLDGEEATLLDVLFTRSNTVSLHWPQTPLLLELPGEHVDVPGERRRHLRDLVLTLDAEHRRCMIRDRNGQRYIPCFLSPLQQEILPSVAKLLDLFGTMTRGVLRLPRTPRIRDGVELYPRLWLGRLLILRRRWIVPIDRIPTWDGPEADAFLAVQRWRRSLEIPDQIFLVERVISPNSSSKAFKPQYIDFRSPELVTLFRASIATADEPVTIEEAVPTPEAFPVDTGGERRGVEVLLEGLPLLYPARDRV
jgi:hypothetical protein